MLGYIAAALIGISLGLIGGGGSILTLPMLVYLFGIAPVLATSYSLFIVGSTSVIGAILNWRRKQVNIKTALLFGLSSVVTVFAIRKYLTPFIPARIAINKSIEIPTSMITMVSFAVLMIVAAFSMTSSRKIQPDSTPAVSGNKMFKLLVCGVSVGAVTGLLGAGGGFLLIPVLVLLLHQPMKIAVGTSLLIISMNSLLGFTGDLNHFNFDWRLLLTVSAIAIAGMFIGVMLSGKISGEKLKKAFGWFILVMGVSIIVKELFFR